MKSRRSRAAPLALLVSMHTGQAFSSPPVGGKVFLTKGLHTIKVKAAGGAFSVERVAFGK